MTTYARATRVDWTVLVAGVSLLGVACGGSEDSSSSDQTGGALATGGDSALASGGAVAAGGTLSAGGTANPTGGTPATGGAPATGGTVSTGGTINPTGGTPATGGVPATGGTISTGGTANPTGGAPTTGGSAGAGGEAPTTGGSAGTGGATGGGAGTGGETAGSGGQQETGGAGGATGGSTGVSGGSSIEDYNDGFEEFVGADCDLPEPSLLSPSSHSLPDPFLMPDGTRMSSISEWACQRAWLQKNIEAFVHGEKPRTPDVVTGSVSSSGVDVHVEHGGSSADFSIPISLPAGASGPVPAMFQSAGSGVPSSFLSAEGVAAMPYDHGTAEGAYNAIYGGGGVSLQIKWAWAISRAIDVLVSERDAGNNDIIDPTALGTTGCSFAGKSAFTVGAFDERIALGIPMESGTGGLGSYRVVGDRDLGPNGGEDPEQVSESCGADWFTGELCSGNVDTIPADAHFMVAMYAPRGFTTLQNDRIGHLGPVAQYTAAAAGAEVFKALGIESHVGYHGGNDGDPHNHCTFYPSQEETARNAIRAFLTKSEAPNNFMEPKLKDQSDQPVDWSLESYIDWDTPTLN